MSLLDKFIRYISIDTTSDSSKDNTPSTKSQLEFAKMLIDELNLMNVDEIFFDDKNCYVYAKLKGNEQLPKIGFVAHLDTSEQAKGNDIKPQIICNYDGNDVKLNHSQIISSEMYPDLKTHKGKTLITTDGTTLLGSDDKAGIAEIMQMLEYFSLNKEEHGDIYVCFTPDEEIGKGADHFDIPFFGADFAYTIDGGAINEINYENFNAASATITVHGNSIHPGSAKGKMKNSILIAQEFNNLLPKDAIPFKTEGYEGFNHLCDIQGNCEKTIMNYILRNHDLNQLKQQKEDFHQAALQLNQKYGKETIEMDIHDSYYNMKDLILKNKEVLNRVFQAYKKLNLSYQIVPIRGGTDGARLSYDGLLTPNLGTGGYNCHGKYEFVSIQQMQLMVEILKEITK